MTGNYSINRILHCILPFYISMAWCKTAVSPLQSCAMPLLSHFDVRWSHSDSKSTFVGSTCNKPLPEPMLTKLPSAISIAY